MCCLATGGQAQGDVQPTERAPESHSRRTADSLEATAAAGGKQHSVRGKPRDATTVVRFYSSSHLSASTPRSVPAWIMTCQCFQSSAISVVIWFLAVSSFTTSHRLSFDLPRFRFPSTVICNVFLVVSSLSCLCTCPNHLNLFSLRNSAIGHHLMSTFLT